jgi:GTP-binding protein HflX
VTRQKNAIIVQRVDQYSEPDTDEIEKLARSAGYSIKDVLTQSRSEDIEYNIGEGKVPEVYRSVKQNDAYTVIIDNEMGPYQMYNFGVYLPNEIIINDRYKLILEIFEQRATTKKSQLQVELAKLRYEQPRAEVKVDLAQRNEKPGFMSLGEYNKGRKKDIQRRMRRMKSEIEDLQRQNRERREHRRESGFSLVSIAGYTNAGKSTLLRRLSESLSVSENKNIHDDIQPTAESTDKLFTTLNTTTKKMDFDKRDVLLTDTIGLIEDLPQWLLKAFRATFDNIFNSELVVLVADATKSVQEIRKRLSSCHNIFFRNDIDGRLITVFNKVGSISQQKKQTLSSDISSIAPNPIFVDAKTGTNISKLKSRIHSQLPPLTKERIQIPLADRNMSVVSWIHDNAYVHEETYSSNHVIISFEAQNDIIQKVRAKVEQ